jgi:hypothetical protein
MHSDAFGEAFEYGLFMINDAMSLPRSGPLGVWDHVAGPGADPLETGLIVGAMIAGPGLAVAWARAAGVDWTWWQWLVLAILACELVGSLACNTLGPAKRWHHRATQGARQHFIFCALHLHPLVLALAFPDALSLRDGLLVYGLLIAGAGLIIASPIRIRTAAAILYSVAAVAICGLWIPLASPVGWLPAVLYLSLLAGYLVPPPEGAPEVSAQVSVHHHGPWS